ncbi:cytochrome c oxidase subunit 2A [Evansella sp. AB-P1]|nr:cytochrome c oxidase subunit 2A [Evansella sp. AB-P1]MDG5785978.1 cytochrome c oxidase subunit 2A [Evansella sp. AB-P1]
MAERKLMEEEKTESKFGASMGTWVSLGIVGGFIVLTYILLFGVYMARL